MKEVKKITDYCKVIAGQSPKGSSYNETGNGIEFHQGKKAFGDYYINHSNVWTTEITKIAEPGDILMSVRAPVGPTNITNRSICIGRGLAAIRCNSGVNPQFILYALKNIENRIVGNNGAVFNSINKEMIENLPVPSFDPEEQQQIVDFLDAEFAKIDELKNQAEQSLQNAKDLFQAALKEMLTPKEGWKVLPLKDVAKYRRGSFPQPYGKAEWYDGPESMPFVQVADLNEDSFDLVEQTKKRISKLAQPLSVFVPQNTVLVSLQGSIGKVSITQYDSYVDRTVAIFYDYIIDIDKTFFAYQLKTKFAQERLKARGTTIKTITKEEFAEFEIFVPSLHEQIEFVEKISKVYEVFAQLTSNYTRTIQLCADLKQALLRQVFE